MRAYRLGKIVFAKDVLTRKLENENLSPAEAKTLMKDFHRIMELKAKFSTGNLSDTDRAIFQAEYDTLLNTYFGIR